MSILHMTIDPSFTHRVVEILNEKLWDGDIQGIHDFMSNSFGITNDKLISRILTGKYVMVFNEDGSGNIKPREEVTEKEQEAMMGLPDTLGPKEIREAIHLRVTGRTGFLERQKFVILNFRDLVINIHQVHDVDLHSNVLDSGVARLLGSIESDTLISTSMTSQEIISIYNKAKDDETSKDLIESIKEANGNASKLIYVMDEVNSLFREQTSLIKTMDYIKEYIFDDIRNIDMYKTDGTKSTRDEQMEDPYRYFWMQDFHSRCNEINEYYQFLIADADHQDTISKQAAANEMITHAAIHGMTDSEYPTKRHNTGNSALDTYLDTVMSEHPTAPVKPTDGRWDAGWISPDGAFWADKGGKANFIHLTLAQEIQKYYADTYDWIVKTENPDRELEKHGWLKFHHDEVAFLGYGDLTPDNLSQHRITMRQIDKLHDYAVRMGYTKLYVVVTRKPIDVTTMFDISPEEWQEIFEW